MSDRGGEPLVMNMDLAAGLNRNFRTAIWTGDDVQVTLMRIPACGETGAGILRRVDQLLYVVGGTCAAEMGPDRRSMSYVKRAECGYGIFIPRRTWYNVRNTGDGPLLLFAVSAPPSCGFGRVDETRPDGDGNGRY